MIGSISFIGFSLLSGYLEAYFWESKPRVSQRWSHIALTCLRAAALAPIVWYEGFWTGLALACMFPFLHDGAYYETRNKIDSDVYPLGWKDTSTTTGAIISLDFTQRTIAFICGLSLLIINIIL